MIGCYEVATGASATDIAWSRSVGGAPDDARTYPRRFRPVHVARQAQACADEMTAMSNFGHSVKVSA